MTVGQRHLLQMPIPQKSDCHTIPDYAVISLNRLDVYFMRVQFCDLQARPPSIHPCVVILPASCIVTCMV